MEGSLSSFLSFSLPPFILLFPLFPPLHSFFLLVHFTNEKIEVKTSLITLQSHTFSKSSDVRPTHPTPPPLFPNSSVYPKRPNGSLTSLLPYITLILSQEAGGRKSLLLDFLPNTTRNFAGPFEYF